MELVGIVWFLGMCIGHAALLTLSINWWYSFPLPHRFLTCLRLFHGGIVVLGLAAFTRAYLYPSWIAELGPLGGFGQTISQAYAFVCGLIGLGYMPLLTLWRIFRGRPVALRSNHTSTVDVASRLGYKPIGRGKYRALAYLPGNEIFRVDFAER